jgi:hypothetical protein
MHVFTNFLIWEDAKYLNNAIKLNLNKIEHVLGKYEPCKENFWNIRNKWGHMDFKNTY